MILLLIGENDYAINARIDALIDQAKGSVKKFWAEDTESSDVIQATSEQSLFDEPVDLVVVRRLQDNSSLAGDLADQIDQVHEAALVITADKVDKRSKLYSLLKKKMLSRNLTISSNTNSSLLPPIN